MPATKTCPSSSDLKAYAVGKLSPEREEQLADHVEKCNDCETKLQALESHGDSFIGRLRLPVQVNPYAEEPEFQRIAQLVERRVVAKSLPTSSHGGDSALPCPGRFHEYDLLSKLGEGGMGTVYKARHRHLKKFVAIKILPPGLAKDPERVARFKREMHAVGQLDEPQIVRAIDAGVAEGRHFLAMEYVEGLDLSEICRRVGRLPIADACEIARCVAIGLKAADQKGLIHRDIKPSNLMITRDGHVKILDLGLAVFEDDRHVDAATTSPGQILGTPEYIAPEQISNARTVDIRADIYSLGCTLFRFLTGVAPFSSPRYPGVMEIMAAHLRDPAPPIAKLRTDVPAKLATIIERTLEKDRDLRIPTPGRLADDLRAFCGGADLAGLYAKAAKVEAAARERSVAATASFREGDSLIETPLAAAKPAVAHSPAASTGLFDPYHKWLGIAPKDQPPTHYKLLGLEPFESDREVIHGAVMRQSAHVRNYQLGQYSELSQRILNEISAAKICLLDADKKKFYDSQLRKQMASAKRRAESLVAIRATPIIAPSTDHSGIDLSGNGQAAIELSDPEVVELAGPEIIELPSTLSPSPLSHGFDIESLIGDTSNSNKPALPPQSAVPAWLTADDDDELAERSPGLATRVWNSTKVLATSAKLQALKLVARAKAIKWREWSAVQWTAIGAAFAGVFVLAAVALSLRTPNGTVVIEVSNAPENLQVSVDGNSIDIKGLRNPLSIKVGEHDLEVNAANFQTHTQKFSVTSGSESRVTVILVPNAVPTPKPSNIVSEVANSPVNPPTTAPIDAVKPSQVSITAVAPFDSAKAKILQEASAKQLGLPVEMTNSIGMKLLWVPPGSFTMGSPPEDVGHFPDENQATVTIATGFYFGKYSVTQAEFAAVTRSTPWSGKGHVKESDNCPATYVDWNEAANFCKKLNAIEQAAGKLPDGYEYQLPTEAQREYASRGGTATAYSFGNDSSDLSDYGWWGENCRTEQYAHCVGRKKPNPFGFYDLHGNVYEWCRDFYKKELPGGTDPKVNTGSARVLRGGGWSAGARFCRSADRVCLSPADRDAHLGFRVALGQAVTASEEAKAPVSPSPPPQSVPEDREADSLPRAVGGSSKPNARLVPYDHSRKQAVGLTIPQYQYEVLCDDKRLRLTAWNNSQYLYVQAIIWDVEGDSVGRIDNGQQLRCTSCLSIGVDPTGRVRSYADRAYWLNPSPSVSGLVYDIRTASNTNTTSDTKGIGAIRYLNSNQGHRVRVDTYLIPLSEIGNRPGEKLQLAYWGFSPKPNHIVNSIGYDSHAMYWPDDMPLASYNTLMLSVRNDSFAPRLICEHWQDLANVDGAQQSTAEPNVRQKAPEVEKPQVAPAAPALAPVAPARTVANEPLTMIGRRVASEINSGRFANLLTEKKTVTVIFFEDSRSAPESWNELGMLRNLFCEQINASGGSASTSPQINEIAFSIRPTGIVKPADLTQFTSNLSTDTILVGIYYNRGKIRDLTFAVKDQRLNRLWPFKPSMSFQPGIVDISESTPALNEQIIKYAQQHKPAAKDTSGLAYVQSALQAVGSPQQVNRFGRLIDKCDPIFPGDILEFRSAILNKNNQAVPYHVAIIGRVDKPTEFLTSVGEIDCTSFKQGLYVYRPEKAK